jgi:TM2 domain-containing membrane protein YozV
MRSRVKFKFIAFLWALLLGWAGVHKFYLGQIVQGILYLILLFIFGWMGALLMWVASIREGIGYLLMSDDEFNRQYNPGEPFMSPEARISYLITGATPNLFNQSKQPRTGSAHDTISTLRELKSLYDEGIITANEYEQKRKKLLDLM